MDAHQITFSIDNIRNHFKERDGQAVHDVEDWKDIIFENIYPNFTNVRSYKILTLLMYERGEKQRKNLADNETRHKGLEVQVILEDSAPKDPVFREMVNKAVTKLRNHAENLKSVVNIDFPEGNSNDDLTKENDEEGWCVVASDGIKEDWVLPDTYKIFFDSDGKGLSLRLPAISN